MTKNDSPALNTPQPYKFTPEVQRIALHVVAETGNRQLACDAVQINRSTFDRLLRKDPTFRQCYEEAQNRWVAHLEALAHTLAKGTVHRKPGPGGIMYDEVKHHPTVLLHLLKVSDPKKHGERKTVDHNHVHTQQIGLDALSQEQRDQLQAIILSQMEPAKVIDVEIGDAKPIDSEPPESVESEDDARPADESPTDVS